MTNIKHWLQLMTTSRFGTLEKPGQPMQDYPVWYLKEFMAPIDEILLMVGTKDVLSTEKDLERLLPWLP